MMKIGVHISAAGGVFQAPLNAQNIGCETYQFFSRSPRGGKAPALTKEILEKFRKNNEKGGFDRFYIHSPYYINLASSKNNIYFASISVLREELERGSVLGVKSIMFHIGSAKDLEREEALEKAAEGVYKIMENYKGSCDLSLEISAGAGEIIGDNFEEIAFIIKKAEEKGISKKLRVCFDTAHAFESGYDISSEKEIKKVFNEFNKKIGIERLSLVHINDSKTPFNSRKDRHAHIGEGEIGEEGFRIFLKELQERGLKDIDLILETPGDDKRVDDIKILKKLRDKS